MASRRLKQPDLQVPVPKFPLSSPISEEISSPSCSSAEEREMERNRPFDFLVKSTRQKIEKSQKDKHTSRSSHGGSSSRLSIRGMGITKRKQAAKPVGLNLVTNFALEDPPKRKKSSRDGTVAPFVDLNDLKQLSKAREQERTAQKDNVNVNGDWKDASKKRVSRSFQQLEGEEESPALYSQTRGSFLEPSSENPFADRSEHGFSPSDRNVMIGLTVPYHETHNRSRELDHNGDQQTPLTPSIIVTPAQEEAPWSVDMSSPEGLRSRATSSVYSQPTPRLWSDGADIPPVPAIPQEHTSSKRKDVEPSFLNAHFTAMTRKRRSASASVVLDTQSPDTERPTSILTDHEHDHDHDRRLLDRLSVNPEASRPQSQGWWNVLLSPLLGRSNTLSSKKSPISPGFPPSPSVAPSSLGTNRHWWEKEKESEKEKEISCFSPDTPETAVTNQWQDKMPSVEQSRSLDDTSAPPLPPVPDRQAAMSMMFPGNRIQGEAAEYYQACAHELFSKTSYFECYNHTCSLTPLSATGQPSVGAVVTGDRGLVVAEPEAETLSADSQVKDAEVATVARGLLIDVNSPTEETAKEKETGCAKCTHLRASTGSVDSWASTTVDTVVGDNEKSLPEIPKENTRELVPERPVQQVPQLLQPSVQEPVPVPAAYFPPEPPAPTPAPAPYVPPEPLTRELEPSPAPYYPSEPLMPGPAPYVPPEPLAQAPPPQIINNYHYGTAPYEVPPQAPVTVERAIPHYIPVYPSNNPFFPPPQDQKQAEEADLAKAPPVPHAYSQEPPQEADITKVPAEFQDAPHGSATQESERSLEHLAPPGNQEPHQALEPMSPGFQHAAGGPSSIQLSDVNAPAPTYAQHTRDIPLPQRYDLYPAPGVAVMDPTGAIGPAEAHRRRLEREDAVGRKVGGLWRGRGCFSKGGCFGRPGREGRLRRRWYLGIAALFLIIIIVAIALATTLTKKTDSTPVQSQWVNLTNYPPIQTGIMTIAGTEPQALNSGCINIPTMWSCALPKGTQQSGNSPYSADQPTFRVEIRYRNGTSSNSTDSGTYNSTTIKRDVWSADPSAPSIADQTFLGNTTDKNSKPYAGEETPFYLSVLSPAHLSSTNVFRRSASASHSSTSTSTSLNSTSLIPAPTEDSDGTAAAATLYPLPSSQPVRLYNRGESSEHYGFYTYFDKSIFLNSRAPLNNSKFDYASEDQNGGSTKEDAQTRCTWSQTRFLVQIWTNPSKMGYSLLSAGSGSGSSTATATATATSTSSTATSSSSATDYTTPGSFPYPVTITLDRHGGVEDKKRVYCYGVEESGHYNFTEARLQLETLGAGGTLINGYGDDAGYGGIDGGTGGCKCSWINWISTS
ncbi:hypothetical protein N7478_009175 [Penicillium angulare]|uniref:uncharacterized protein n=1 Tax=Penicillium angulare TaxID=116970 RepID=UPI002540E10D|nr:uncharacterized protein N7478_009175 [Penicillium angulare]KAJ5274050.1 hypothetical protein N7478_009175 [Penicillium angulare]